MPEPETTTTAPAPAPEVAAPPVTTAPAESPNTVEDIEVVGRRPTPVESTEVVTEVGPGGIGQSHYLGSIAGFTIRGGYGVDPNITSPGDSKLYGDFTAAGNIPRLLGVSASAAGPFKDATILVEGRGRVSLNGDFRVSAEVGISPATFNVMGVPVQPFATIDEEGNTGFKISTGVNF
jgi:hypothetical protein